MRTDWYTRPLGQVCTIKPPKSEARARLTQNELVSFVPMEDLGIDRKFVCGSQEKPLSAVVGSYTYFADGDVLLAKITPCFENGKLGIAKSLANGIGFGSSEFIVFRPTPALNKDWLYYFLSRESFREEGAARMAGAVGHKRVAKEFIENYPIPVPPLPEQQRIVAILDETLEGVATAKANAEKNLQNAREIFESQLATVFAKREGEWNRVRIYDACESIVDCINKTAPKHSGPTPFKMIRTTNVRNGLVSLDSVNYVSEETYYIWTRRQIPKKGDVLLTREAPMGEVGMLMTDDKVFLGQRIVSYRANPSILNNRFLLYALQSSDIQAQIRAFASGSTVQHMRVPDSNNLMLPLPGLAEQLRTVATLDALREEAGRLTNIYERKCAALDALKASLLHSAFAGEIKADKTSELIEAVA